MVRGMHPARPQEPRAANIDAATLLHRLHHLEFIEGLLPDGRKPFAAATPQAISKEPEPPHHKDLLGRNRRIGFHDITTRRPPPEWIGGSPAAHAPEKRIKGSARMAQARIRDTGEQSRRVPKQHGFRVDDGAEYLILVGGQHFRHHRHIKPARIKARDVCKQTQHGPNGGDIIMHLSKGGGLPVRVTAATMKLARPRQNVHTEGHHAAGVFNGINPAVRGPEVDTNTRCRNSEAPRAKTDGRLGVIRIERCLATDRDPRNLNRKDARPVNLGERIDETLVTRGCLHAHAGKEGNQRQSNKEAKTRPPTHRASP